MAAGAAVVVCAFLGAVLFGYQDIYPGVTVDGLEVGKLDREQVLTLLQQEYADRQQALGQVSIIVNGEQHDLDISNMGAAYNLEQTADNACAYGRDGNIFHRAPFSAGRISRPPSTWTLRWWKARWTTWPPR